jgi:hypothetical protein
LSTVAGVLSSGPGTAHFSFLDLVLDLSFLCHVAPFELACQMPPSFVVTKSKFFGIRKFEIQRETSLAQQAKLFPRLARSTESVGWRQSPGAIYRI